MFRRGFPAILAAAVIIATGFGLCFAGENVRITSSGETLYYVSTVPPDISVTPTSLNFGTVQVGNTPTLSVTVTNNGAGALVIGTVTSPASPYSKSADTCSGQTLAQSATCAITIRFAPTADGTFNSSFSIPSNDPDTPSVTVTITGQGTTIAPMISATPNPVNFGTVNVGTNANATVTVQNTGTANLTISSITNPSSPFSRTGGTCTNGTVLAPSATCTINLRFSPTAQGSFTGSFVITSNAANNPSLTINLSGVGAVVPQISISPNPVNFGSVNTGSSSTQTVTVSSVGSANLTLGSITSPSAPFSTTSATCSAGQVLPPGSSCTITVRFSPTSNGTFNGSFIVYSDTGGVANTPTTVNLTGTGVPPCGQITASPNPLNFGSVAVGSSSAQTITVSNAGSGNLTISSVSSLSAPFSIVSNNCTGATLTPGGSCQVVIWFVPTASGTFSGNLLISNNSACVPTNTSVPISGSATSAGGGGGALSVQARYIGFVSINGSTPAPYTAIKVTNTGSGDLTLNSISFSPSVTNSATCAVGMTIAPPSTRYCEIYVAGSTNVTIASDGGSTTVSTAGAPVGSVATVDPTILTSYKSLNFGAISRGTYADLYLTVWNVGSKYSTLGSPYTFSTSSPFSIMIWSGWCSGNLGSTKDLASYACTYRITFAPTTIGTFSRTLTFSSNAVNAPALNIYLTGYAY